MVIISFIAFIFFIAMGYMEPRRMGWFIITIFPLTYAAYATFIPSSFFPLNSVRLAFAVTLGIMLRNNNPNLAPQKLLKIFSVKVIAFFLLLIVIVSYQERLMPLVSNYLPGFFFALVLPFILIKDENDLVRLMKIMSWQASIIGFLVIVEYATEFNFFDIFAKMNEENFEMVDYEKEIIYRGGFKRVAGLGGNAVDTAYLLAFYFPITLWYANKNNIINKIPILLIMTGFILLQTRASFIALGVAFVFLLYQNTKLRFSNKGVSFSIIIKTVFLIVISISILSLIYPKLILILERFFEGMFTDIGGFGVEEKINRVPLAIGYILNNLLWGYGSPSYAYYEVMKTADLPSPLIYFLSGGIVLGSIYLIMLASIVFSTTKFIRNLSLNPERRKIIIFISTALVAGFVVVFSNWREKHFLTMFILYIATMKVFLVNPSLNKIRRQV